MIENWCIGCGLCAENCPYGNINMVEQFDSKTKAEVRKATTCDLCTEPGPRPRAKLRLRLPPRRRPPHEGNRTAGAGTRECRQILRCDRRFQGTPDGVSNGLAMKVRGKVGAAIGPSFGRTPAHAITSATLPPFSSRR